MMLRTVERLLWRVGVFFLLLIWPAVVLSASIPVPVGSWVYPALERLEAEGALSTGILTSRPINRTEAARLIAHAESRDLSPAAARIIQKLKREFDAELKVLPSTYLSPLDAAGFKYVYANGVPHFLNLNNKGDVFGNGSSYRASFNSSAGVGGLLGFYLNPEIRYPEGVTGDDAEVVLFEGYAAIELWNFEVTAGRQSLWWGPGEHGALLLSSNARPFDLIKLTNPKPALLPWLFRYLGPVKFTGFVTRLEEDRDIPNPYLAGMRLDLKPHKYVNIGLSRTAMFGGAGRHVDLGVVWDIITAQSENVAASEPGNQLGSLDLKIALPFDFQKIVLYGELGGEDESGSLPSRVAYIVGAYLPDTGGLDGVDLRVEYGQTYIGQYPDLWYGHHIYTSGYIYDGRIIGHHMGTDAKDLFISVAYASDYGDITAVADLEASGRAVKAKNRSFAFSWSRILDDMTRLALGYAFDRRTAVDGIDGNDIDAHSLIGSVNFGF